MKIKQLVALTLTVILVLPLAYVAANWQWSRHLERETRNSQIVNNSAKTMTLDELLTKSDISPLQYTQIRVSGDVIDESQKFWRRQILNGQPGFVALVRVATDSGEVAVARGWVAAAGSIPDPNISLDAPDVLNNVTTRVRLAPSAEADPSDLPPGQTNSVGTMTDELFYLEVIQSDAPLLSIPAPEIESGPHLGYVGQWILIGITAVVAYIVILRRSYASDTKSA
jgi:cytochrome oxidase assembly protein ShyY1